MIPRYLIFTVASRKVMKKYLLVKVLSQVKGSLTDIIIIIIIIIIYAKV